ncbi:MAG TPA: glycosyltransferase [Candidatus Hydrogenedentes bacterium]|nr:glycosyltransferase [Candidatus Hydrogenedentota bacterium]
MTPSAPVSAPISIIIPAFNQLEYCRQCVHSVLLNTDLSYKLVLVDNGSTDGVSEFFDGVPGATVVHTGRNLGFAAGVNRGLEHAEGHALLLNSDTLVSRGWLGRLERALRSADDIGMVGPRSNLVSGSQQIDGLEFTSMGEIDAFAAARAESHAGQVRDVARLVGFCLLIRDKVLAQVGGLDESYGIGNYEDDDYCVLVLRAGWRLCVAEDAFVFHYGGRTFLGMGIVEEDWRALMDENRRRFEAKWDLKPGERIDAVQQALEVNRRACAALEAGDVAGALRLFKDAIALAPHEARHYNDLGVALWQAGDAARAYDHFTRALRRDPHYAEARENLRHAAEALGRAEDARALLQRLDSRKD